MLAAAGSIAGHSNGKVSEPINSMEEDDCDITPINDYNVEEGKIRSSFLWLVSRVYGNNIPDALCTPFYSDDKGCLHLKPPAKQSLVSGELYCQAASKIFSEPGFIQQDHSIVLQTLRAMSIPVLDTNSNEPVTETLLIHDTPMKNSAHLGMIDALMVAHMKSVLSVEKIVNAVKKYTSVHQNEEPIDLEDALLFWVNKVCSTVRDAVEKNGRGSEHIPLIPEMEDLYEDMCDGACMAVLLSFYMPDKLPLNEICLHEPMSIADCVYNLQLVRRFCHMNFAYNPCHFEVEDILYLHEGLRPNVQALLTDVFHFVEPTESENLDPAPVVKHRFERVRPIPGLREYPTNNKVVSLRTGHRAHGPMSHAPSLMNSADSLMTQKSVDSLKQPRVREKKVEAIRKSPTTSFGELKSAGNTPAHNVRTAFDALSPTEPLNPYQRSDSMPSASVRLALEEKRRQLQNQKAQELSLKAQEQQEIGKQAFFNIMGKPQTRASDKLVHTTNGTVTAMRQKRLGAGDGEQFDQLNKSVQQLQQQIHRLSLDQQNLQHQVCTDQQVRGDEQFRLQHAMSHSALYPSSTNLGPSSAANFGQTAASFSQNATNFGSPSLNNNQSGSNFAQPPMTNGQMMGNFGQSPNYSNQPGSSIYASPINMNNQQQFLMTPQIVGGPPSPASISYAMPDQSINPSANSMAGSPAFRLHTETEPASRLDPSLQLNRGDNLTNWGMTYKINGTANGKTPRRTWDSQTFANAGYGPNGVYPQSYGPPQAQQYQTQFTSPPQQQLAQFHQQQQQQQQQQQVPVSYGNEPFRMAHSGSRPPSYPSAEGSTPSPGPMPTGDYPQEQSSPMGYRGEVDQRLSISGDILVPNVPVQAAVVITPKPSLEENIGKEMSPGTHFTVGGHEEEEKLEQRKEQLLANAMRRQEMMEKRKEKLETEAAAKRLKDQAKQEEAERKKMEKEIRRQKVLEEYQKRKAEQEQLENTLSMGSGASQPGSNTGTPRTTRIMRGHSQPPRPKSQVFTTKRNDGSVPPSTSSDNLDHMSVSTISAPASTAEPTLKLFVKPTQKSNRNIVYNAIQYSVLAGAVHDATKRQVLQEFAKSESKHFLLLFRDGMKMQYRGLYTWDEQSDTTHKLHGTGPKLCNETMMDMMFKYDSGGKKFGYIASKHLSATIDGFTIKDDFWQKKKQPFSGTR